MKFECQTSCGGKCCKPQWDGKAGYVFLTKGDMVSISGFLKKPIKAFAEKAQFAFTRFTKKESWQWFLKDGEKQCQFLKEGKCSIYEVRPTQCRTFPFWPELMVNTSYESLKEFCPGIGVGPEVTHHLLSEQVKADKELCNQET